MTLSEVLFLAVAAGAGAGFISLAMDAATDDLAGLADIDDDLVGLADIDEGLVGLMDVADAFC